MINSLIKNKTGARQDAHADCASEDDSCDTALCHDFRQFSNVIATPDNAHSLPEKSLGDCALPPFTTKRRCDAVSLPAPSCAGTPQGIPPMPRLAPAQSAAEARIQRHASRTISFTLADKPFEDLKETSDDFDFPKPEFTVGELCEYHVTTQTCARRLEIAGPSDYSWDMPQGELTHDRCTLISTPHPTPSPFSAISYLIPESTLSAHVDTETSDEIAQDPSLPEGSPKLYIKGVTDLTPTTQRQLNQAFQRHHVIPRQLFGKQKYANMFRLLEFDQNDPLNLVSLPTDREPPPKKAENMFTPSSHKTFKERYEESSIHNGSHDKGYIEPIKEELDKIYSDLHENGQNPSPQQIQTSKSELCDLLRKTKDGLLNKNIKLNKRSV